MTDPTPDVPTLRRLLAEATPGPWVHSDVLPGHVYARRIFGDVIVGAPRNATCAAAAVNTLPGILDRLEAVTKVLGEYFDFDADPWDDHDAACPAPEDIWRLHRDLRAALAEVTP